MGRLGSGSRSFGRREHGLKTRATVGAIGGTGFQPVLIPFPRYRTVTKSLWFSRTWARFSFARWAGSVDGVTVGASPLGKAVSFAGSARRADWSLRNASHVARSPSVG